MRMRRLGCRRAVPRCRTACRKARASGPSSRWRSASACRRSIPPSPTPRCRPWPRSCTPRRPISVWIVNAYQLAMVATLLPMAALGETIGYRRVYVGRHGRVHAGLAGVRAVVVAAGADRRAAVPGPGRGDADGREHGAAARGVSGQAAGPRLRQQCAGGGDRLRARAEPGVDHPRGVVVGMAVRHQRAAGHRRVLPRAQGAAGEPAAPATSVDGVAGLFNVVAFGMAVLALGDAAHRVGIRTAAARGARRARVLRAAAAARDAAIRRRCCRSTCSAGRCSRCRP